MSMNSSGGLQKLVNTCQLKTEIKKHKMSSNLPDNPYDLKYTYFSIE